uniref:Uncharacterized protein n=1 Tax=Oryza punctata TaxID=4537 RepID=A0A0E0KWS0_ORYPU
MENHEISSVHELRTVVWGSDSSTNLLFTVAEDVPLKDARQLFEAVSTTSGYGQLANLLLLRGKDNARSLVQKKLRQLRRWVAHVDKQLVKFEDAIEGFDAMIDAGGPGIPNNFEPMRLDGPDPFLDIDQIGEHESVRQHIRQINDTYLQASPASPHSEEGEKTGPTEDEVREEDDLRAFALFNLKYLRIKRDCLLVLRTRIQEGVANLEQYKSDRTVLGCGTGRSYVRFFDIPIYPGDKVRESDSDDSDD